MYKIERCSICNHPLHIHKNSEGYYIRNICKCISKIEIYIYNYQNKIISPVYYTKQKLASFLKTMGFWEE